MLDLDVNGPHNPLTAHSYQPGHFHAVNTWTSYYYSHIQIPVKTPQGPPPKKKNKQTNQQQPKTTTTTKQKKTSKQANRQTKQKCNNYQNFVIFLLSIFQNFSNHVQWPYDFSGCSVLAWHLISETYFAKN